VSQVRLELGDQRAGDRDRTHACVALRWADDRLAVLELGHLLNDADRRVQQIETTSGERA
jgi:hypothetical protein